MGMKQAVRRVLAAAGVLGFAVLAAASFGAAGSPGQEKALRSFGLMRGSSGRAGISDAPPHWIKDYFGFFATQLVSESSGGYFHGYASGKLSKYEDGDFSAILPATDGGVVVAGQASYEISATPLVRIKDGLIIKILPSGVVDWKVLVESDVSTDQYYGFSGLLPTADGGYFAMGSAPARQPDYASRMLALKLGPDRSLAWIKSFGAFDDSQSLGESGDAAVASADGGVVILSSTFSFGSTLQDIWVVKLNAQGDIVWQEAFGTDLWDTPGGICSTPDGGFLVVGNSMTYNGTHADTALAFVLRLAANGKPLWTKVYGEDFAPDSSYRAEPHGVVSNPDGTALMVGTSGYHCHSCVPDAWMVKLSRSGSIVWQKGWRSGGNVVTPGSVQIARDGGYIVTGYGSAFSFDQDGTPRWGKAFGNGIYYFSGHSPFCQSPDGRLWMAATLTDYSAPDVDDWYSAGTVLNLDSTGSLGGTCDVIRDGAVTAWTTHGISKPKDYNFRRTSGGARYLGYQLREGLHAIKTICTGN